MKISDLNQLNKATASDRLLITDYNSSGDALNSYAITISTLSSAINTSVYSSIVSQIPAVVTDVVNTSLQADAVAKAFRNKYVAGSTGAGGYNPTAEDIVLIANVENKANGLPIDTLTGAIKDYLEVAAIDSIVSEVVADPDVLGTINTAINGYFSNLDEKLTDDHLTTIVSDILQANYVTTDYLVTKYKIWADTQMWINNHLEDYALKSWVQGKFALTDHSHDQYALKTSLEDYAQTSWITENYYTGTYIEGNFLKRPSDQEINYVTSDTLQLYLSNSSFNTWISNSLPNIVRSYVDEDLSYNDTEDYVSKINVALALL